MKVYGQVHTSLNLIGIQMIKILFFASLKEQLSIDALDFPLTESITVAQLVDELVLKEASERFFCCNRAG